MSNVQQTFIFENLSICDSGCKMQITDNKSKGFWKKKIEKVTFDCKQAKRRYFLKKLECKELERKNRYRLEDMEEEMLDTELKLVEAEDTIKELEINLKLEEEECFWKGIHRKHIREDLNDLKVNYCYLFCLL